MHIDDYLGIITFGTNAQVVLPLGKLSDGTAKVCFKILHTLTIRTYLNY